MSRSRSAILNWFASILFTVVTMAAGFITTPLIYRPLGMDRYGVVRTLTEIFAYFTLIAQGLSVALVPLLAKSMGVGDRDAVRRTLSAGLRCYAWAIAAILIVGLAALPWLGVFMRVPAALLPELRWSWVINLAGLPLIALIPVKLLVEIDQKGYYISLALLAQSLATSILSVVFVRIGWGVAGVMAATLLGTVLFSLILIVISRRSYRDLLRGVTRVKTSRDDWRSITSLSWPTFLTMVSQRVGMLSDSIILTSMLGPASAATLALNQRLATMVESVLRSIGGAIWPGLVQLHAQGQHEQFNRRMAELTQIVVVLAVAALIPIVCLNEPFVARWIKDPNLQVSTTIAAVASIDTLLIALCYFFSLPLVSTGNVRMLARPSIIGAIVNIIASILFTLLLGAVGPLIGTMISLTTVNLWYYPTLLHRVFGVSRRELLRAVLVPCAWGIPYAFVVWWVVDATRPTHLLSIFGIIGLLATLFLGFSYGAILNKHDRELWRARVFTPLLRRVWG